MNHKFVYQNSYQEEPPENVVVGFRLANGLRVLMMKKHRVPIVAVDLWYRVGSANEVPGKSGFAHLFEHMMFEGSANVKKAEHMKLINDVGGIVNGSTTQDRTNYWEVVPANQLELALWLEADRMRSLNLSEENFNNQRDTVKEERRMRVDNQPYMQVLFELKDELAYHKFPYGHSVIGSMDDLDRATLEDVRNFHELYYRPNNAILSLVGDFEVRDALALVERHFGDIAAGPEIPPVDLSEPPLAENVVKSVTDPFAPFPAFVFAYKISDRKHEDFYALSAIEKILFDGESSRLYHRLVEREPLALHLFGGIDGKFGPALLFGFAQVNPASDYRKMVGVLNEELKRICEEKVTPAELEKFRNKIRAEFLSRRESARVTADQLCFYDMVFDKPAFLFEEESRFLSVDRGNILKAAQKYLGEAKRVEIDIFPQTGREGGRQ